MTLRAGDWTLALRPDLGGAIGALRFAGRDILRPTPDEATDVLQTACFPLLPYANRIDRGRFTFSGRRVDLGPTPGFEPHALHGVGWRAPWRMEADAWSATMTLDHAAGDWPWAFRAEQSFTLTDDGLVVSLSMTNTGRDPMPAGLGLHPYFVRRPGARLALGGRQVWTTDASLIPIALRPADAVFDWSGGPALDTAPFVDNAYAGWVGLARLADEAGVVELRAATAFVHVYAPRDEAFVCVEPVTHRPDALNAPASEPSGLVILAPGETLSLAMSLTAS